MSDDEGEAPFDEEITILAARPGQRCEICRTPIKEGDRVRLSAETSDGPLLARHVRCIRAAGGT